MSELAEGARLEIVCAVYSSTEGSNPSLSANTGLICMSYLVLARKYRPQIFEQVVKQDHITRTLANAILSNRMHHAVLFSGPRGTGKTTVARILAKAMNCEDGPTPAPCNQCKICREITTGSGIDCFEIDGASNNSVDQVRELCENVKYLPAHSRFKIYIIDEVHMLSTAAFNALLKTLEEPPSHVMFILATTESHKIPATVLSRCQRHDFRRIGIKSIVEHMVNLCAREGFNISPSSLDIIAREAGGCMRDALSLLDQVMVCSMEGAEQKDVADILGIVDRKIIFNTSAALFDGNISALLEILDEIYYTGHDIRKFYKDLTLHFRNILIIKVAKQTEGLVDLPDHEIDSIKDQIKEISSVLINQIFDILFKEASLVKYSDDPKLAIEMIFVRLLSMKPVLPIDQFIKKLDQLKGRIGYLDDHESEEKNYTLTKKGNDNKKSSPVLTLTDKEKKQDSRQSHNGSVSFDSDLQQTREIDAAGDGELPKSDKTVLNPADDPPCAWEKVCDIISKKHPFLKPILIKSSIKKLTDNAAEIEVTGSKHQLGRVTREKNIAIIQKEWQDLFNKKINIIISGKEITEKPKNLKTDQDNLLKQKALKNPLVLDAMEIFNGNIVDVKLVNV